MVVSVKTLKLEYSWFGVGVKGITWEYLELEIPLGPG
jgi:hypothetical protein